MSLLDVRGLEVAYGAIRAVHGVSFSVEEGEVVTLIGSNGAGKTTVLRALTGMVRARAGEVVLAGEAITNRPAHEIVAAGVSHAPEGRRIFGRMTVRENLEMGAYARGRADPDDVARVETLFPILAERRTQKGGTLSGGEQQMLAIGRALMARPRLLLLDEPSLGVAPLYVERIYETLKEINAQGTTILLVEQNANVALDIAHRGYVLETGDIALSGSADDLRSSPEVRRAYLGID